MGDDVPTPALITAACPTANDASDTSPFANPHLTERAQQGTSKIRFPESDVKDITRGTIAGPYVLLGIAYTAI